MCNFPCIWLSVLLSQLKFFRGQYRIKGDRIRTLVEYFQMENIHSFNHEYNNLVIFSSLPYIRFFTTIWSGYCIVEALPGWVRNTGYYTTPPRHNSFRVVKQKILNKRSEWVKYWFDTCERKQNSQKFISYTTRSQTDCLFKQPLKSWKRRL